MTVLAWFCAAVLVGLASIHAYWAAGGFWPGHDSESLARTVVGGPVGMRMQSRGPCLVVASLLGAAAFVVLAAAGSVPAPLSESTLRLGAYVLVGVFGLRGIVGYLDPILRPSIRGSRYERLNRVLYCPLCIVIGLLVYVTAAVH